MAFNKRTWKGRQGVGLNKFSINGASPVTVVNQPDSITEVGDALSAGNLNDLEDRIADAFDETASQEEVTDLKNALEDSEQRIENLEQAVSGSLVTTNTDATQKNTKSITSANTILPWALLNRVGARSVAWNQAVKTLRASGTVAGITFTNNGDGSITLSGTPSAYAVSIAIDATSIPVGHKLLVIGGTSTARLRGASALAYANCDQGNGIIITAQIDTEAYVAVQFQDTTTPVSATLKPQVFDLTAMSEYDSNKTEAQNIASFRAKFPASYYPYNAGQIIDLPSTSFLIRGFNLWNEKWEVGGVSSSTGEKTGATTTIISKNRIQVSPLSSVYFLLPSDGWAYCYDADGNFIKGVEGGANYFTISIGSRIKTMPSNCKYVMFQCTSNYGTSYQDNICVNISQTDTSKPFHNGVYVPYNGATIDTSFTSDYKYVNSSCYDYSENVLVDGQKKREEHRIVGSVDLGTLNWGYDSTYAFFYYLMNDRKEGINFIADGYTNIGAVSDPDMASVPSMSIASNGVLGKWVYIKNTSKNGSDLVNGHASWLEGVKLYFENGTPTTSLHNDPIPNFPSEDGTTITAITPQTDLVNAIDVPNTIAYMTKIGA